MICWEIGNVFASKDTRVRQPLSVAALLAAPAPPLLPSGQVAAIANELSGEAAKRNLEGLALFHRQRGSQGFHAAAELIAERARAYGLRDVEILRFTADGKIQYGTQRSRPAWDVEEAELSEIQHGRAARIASYAASPIVLAEDSESADVTAELVEGRVSRDPRAIEPAVIRTRHRLGVRGLGQRRNLPVRSHRRGRVPADGPGGRQGAARAGRGGSRP